MRFAASGPKAGAAMKIEMRSVKEIKPYANNPRLNDEAVGAVAASIRDFGFLVPIVLKDGVIVAGHTRYKAALRLGLQEVPTVSADDLSEEQANAFRLADNKTGEFSEWNLDLLRSEAEKLREENADLFDACISGYGFSAEELCEKGLTDSEFLDESPDFLTMSFQLHEEQAEFIRSCLKMAEGSNEENFGNKNKNGNAVYAVVKQWADAKKLK